MDVRVAGRVHLDGHMGVALGGQHRAAAKLDARLGVEARPDPVSLSQRTRRLPGGTPAVASRLAHLHKARRLAQDGGAGGHRDGEKHRRGQENPERGHSY
jgi:hypothetical protein